MACGVQLGDGRGEEAISGLSLHEQPRKGGTRHPRMTGTTYPSPGGKPVSTLAYPTGPVPLDMPQF